jgi:phage tail sheath protein FI
MAELKYKSAGVSARIINRTGPTNIAPNGTPAGVIGTSVKGPAFVPTTVATAQDFVVDFGAPSDTRSNGPLASIEWLRNAQSLTFLRVLGVGDGKERLSSGNNSGKVTNAGWVVGQQLPNRVTSTGGALVNNPFATAGGHEGRTFFLGCYMKELGTMFSDAGLQTAGNPIVRGVLMAPSGVYITLSSSRASSNTPSSTGTEAGSNGSLTGSVNLYESRQEFVLLLNGFSNTDPTYPSAITASFDPTAPNYFGNMLNTNPYKLQEAGHYLYSDFKIHPSLAVPTGSNIINGIYGAGAVSGSAKTEEIAFLVHSSQNRNVGTSTVPNFENFEDRFTTAKTPWVISQKFGGNEQNLFKISALSDGDWANTKVKFSIENITPGTDADPYGKFDLLVRDFYDTDKNQLVLEGWRGLTLNPDSPNYIARIIGDHKTYFNFDASVGSQKLVTEGMFPNKSRYIRVEMADSVTNSEIDPSAVPFGFRGAQHFMTSGSAPMPSYTDSVLLAKSNPFYDLVQMPVPFRENISRGTSTNKSVDKGLYWGVQFQQKASTTEPNSSDVFDTNIISFNKYYPNFQTSWQNFVVSNNNGTADTAANGIIDADRFNQNKFSLANVKIALKSNADVDTQNIQYWTYVRNGNITTTSTSRSLDVDDLSNSAVRNVAKFSFFLEGGFNGTNILDSTINDMTNECIVEEINNTSRGINNGPTVSAFDKALDIMSDSTETDIQLLTVPGIRHSIITDKVLLNTEQRFDALAIIDVEQYDSSDLLVTSSNQTVSVTNTAINFGTRGINSSFGCSYFPDVVIVDSFTGKTRQVPPSVAILGAFAKNDAIGFPWFAPAGFTRGALDTTERSAVVLSRDNMDTLQQYNINPIASFAGSNGSIVWGNKTLLQTNSSLDRVNVRRLLIDIRRKVKTVANRMLFEPGRAETLARFSQLVDPILKKIQDQKGLDKYLVKIDTTTTSTADLENRTIRGVIYLQVLNSLEYVSVDFVVTNEV